MKSIETEVVALVERNGRLILQSAGMEQEKGYIQHGAVSCYLHSFFVAYMSVWLAKRFRIRVHLRSLVREHCCTIIFYMIGTSKTLTEKHMVSPTQQQRYKTLSEILL